LSDQKDQPQLTCCLVFYVPGRDISIDSLFIVFVLSFFVSHSQVPVGRALFEAALPESPIPPDQFAGTFVIRSANRNHVERF